MVLLKAFRAGGLAVNAARRAAGAAWRHMRHRHGTADARMRERRAVTAAACTAGAVLMARRCFGAAAGRCMRALAQRLWMVNVGLNIWALNWTVRFWRQADAVVLCRALPARGGDTARTIRVARHALARALADASELRQAYDAQQRVLDAQRQYILSIGDAGGGGGGGGGSGGWDAPAPAAASGGGAGSGWGVGAEAAPTAAAAGPEPLEAAGAPQASACGSGQGECEVCWARQRDTALSCGHLTCARCSVLCADCPFCRRQITQRLRVFV